MRANQTHFEITAVPEAGNNCLPEGLLARTIDETDNAMYAMHLNTEFAQCAK